MIKLAKILYPTDFSELSTCALRYARDLAETFNAKLHVIYVVDEAYQYWVAMGPNTIPVGPSPQDLRQLAEQQMSSFLAEQLGDAKFPVVSQVLQGRPFAEITRYARQQSIDLIVIATHGRGGLTHMLLGSVTEKVVRKAPCPVLTVRHPQHDFIMP